MLYFIHLKIRKLLVHPSAKSSCPKLVGRLADPLAVTELDPADSPTKAASTRWLRSMYEVFSLTARRSRDSNELGDLHHNSFQCSLHLFLGCYGDIGRTEETKGEQRQGEGGAVGHPLMGFRNPR